MDTSIGTYTAKLTDGPLEGKTIRKEFLASGDPQPRIEIPVESGRKRYLYTRVAAWSSPPTIPAATGRAP
jgi:hypothetical protein